MRIQLIASVVIAALLTTGGVIAAPQAAEYGAQPTTAVQQQETLPAQPEIKELSKQETKEQPKQATKTLTKQEATDIALAHAKLTEAEVTGLRGRYDRDDGRPEWDIEFRHGDWEYDYEIHAETGEVRQWDKDYDPPRPAATEPVPTQPPVTEPTVKEPAATQPETKRLTADEAKVIALKHAGLTADQVKYLRSEYDRDDGVPEWEVEFFRDGWEYNYEIHAETGKIRSWEKDRDD